MSFVAAYGLKKIPARIRCYRLHTDGIKKISLSSSTSTSNDSTAFTTLILQQVQDGTLSVDKAVLQLSQSNNAATSIASFANIDHDRYARTNFPEVIFAQSKTPFQVASILDEMAEEQIAKATSQEQKRYVPPILATRYVKNRFVSLILDVYF